MKAEDIEERICLQQFLAEACRRTEGTKVTTVIFDVHTGVPELGGFARIGEQIQRGELDGLPLPLQVPHTLPKGARMGIVIENLHDGTLNIVKVLHFPDELAIPHALKLCLYRRCLRACVPPRPMGGSEDSAVSPATSLGLSGFVEQRL